MIRTAALWLCLCVPAMATTDVYPALYDVIGVAEDDVLNIRSGPGTEFEIIGTIEPNAEGIEVIRPHDDFAWAQVNTGEVAGWVSLDYVVPQPGQWTGTLPEFRQCFGTEPFWSLAYDPPKVRLQIQGEEERNGFISGMYSSRSDRRRFAFTGAYLPTEAGHLDMTMSVRREACGDGMSDRAYGIAVDMLLTLPDADGDLENTGLFSGCCSLMPLSAE